MYLILLTLSPFVTSVHDIKSTAGAPQANWSHMMLWGQPNIPEAARSWQAEQPNRTIKCFLKREGNRKMRWRKGLWGGEIIDCLNKFVTSIKVFLFMKRCMFLFSFSSVLMEQSYWSICGMWSIGKINLDRREAQMFSMFDFFKKNFHGHHPLLQDTALWATYWTSSCTICVLYGLVGAAEPGGERAGLLGTSATIRAWAVLLDWQQKGAMLAFPPRQIPQRTSTVALGLALVPPSGQIALSRYERELI